MNEWLHHVKKENTVCHASKSIDGHDYLVVRTRRDATMCSER